MKFKSLKKLYFVLPFKGGNFTGIKKWLFPLSGPL